MGKLCPECGKQFSKQEILCPDCKVPLSDPEILKKIKRRKPLQWYDGAIVVVAIAIIVLILTQVTIPYTIEENYTVQERYLEPEKYLAQEKHLVQVPYNITQYVVDYEPYIPEKNFTQEVCYYRDTPIEINYMPGLQDTYNPITEVGYRYNKNSVYGSYIQVIEVCRPPTREQNKDSRFNAVFGICYYVGDKKVDCPDRFYTAGEHARAGETKKGNLELDGYQGVYSKDYGKICFKIRNLVWNTPYDERKTIRLEPIQLPQIRVCEEEQVTEKVNSYTKPGQLALKPSLRPVDRAIIKTLYKNVTQFKDIEKTREIEKFREVVMAKKVTKHRSLWEELLLRYWA